jgi:glycosyltransferase involved in cell wall biosynthesis/2-polyprenyl-3-methyl-5-hydroxy-6-metoxy-1,4-benzoquinol methylase/ACT domain-containing protein
MNKNSFEINYILNEVTNVWARPGYGGIAYSDGDEAEQRIAGIINEANDLSVLSSELRQHCTDWVSLYHLTSARANILRPFESDLSGDILEIGAGCGAITRYLGECGGNVLALEGSPRRAAIARSRTRDLPNVKVVSDKFDLFQTDQQFDVITLIGVLEYANLFTTGDSPALTMLERVRSLLRPNGKLFIAIENQLGLKYFAGAPEDHLGQPMYGIEGRYRKDQPQTYGREILSEILKDAGFTACDFLSPLPDYKLPVSILTEEGVSRKDFDAGALAWQSARRDPQLPTHLSFSLELVWPTVFDNQLAIDLANSFLIVASSRNQKLVASDVLAYHYSTDREPEFCKETVFRREESGKIIVEYNRLSDANKYRKDNTLVSFVCPESDTYYFGKPLSFEFVQLVTRDGWSIDEVVKYFEHYLSVLDGIAHDQGIQINLNSPYSPLPGMFFDVVPNNVILREGGNFSLIDKEWDLVSAIELGHLLFRALLQLIGSVSHFGNNSIKGITRGQFINAVLEAMNLALKPIDYVRYIEIEERITEQVTGRPAKEAVQWWPDHPLHTPNLNQAVAERDGQIASFHQVVAERDNQIASLNQALCERDGQVGSLHQVVAELDVQIASLHQVVAERDGQIASLHQVVAEREGQIASLHQVVAERDGQVAALKQGVIDARNELEQVLRSKSWLITKPLRFARRKAVSWPFIAVRRALSDNGRALWRELPISYESKRKLKESLFKTLPWAFRWTKAYQAWDAFGAPVNYVPAVITQKRHPGDIEGEYVPLLKASPLEQKPVKLICFYLPQFHAIPENNEWWGEGFTEWTNVQPAQPQFEGHYQPHVPGELGYYNLLDPAVQRRQVELAKLYGIEGFCFYFYWFGGKRLLEAPIENYLNDKDLDLPFCLCWANENWSRRWDGLDSEILMAQQHSVEDDLAFIQHVSQYMRDPRYIRINGKPLLLVYRPSLLPSAKETASRWRDWCRVNGLGEIYLAYTQSFEAVDPAKYGFDAAIEFPPNNSAPPNVTDSVTPMGDNFGSTVYDWRVFVERSEHYKQQPYTLFRSVCPSWDNTARRQNRGTVFLNSTPALYQRWLENAIRDTEAHRPDPDERLIFVNAWNEWAEGAHLEPDARYGYAWLQATRNALNRESFVPDTRRKVILVAHDAFAAGAQMLAMNLAKTLNEGMGFHVDLVCLGEGVLVGEYAKWATVHLLAGKDPRGAEAKALAQRLYEAGHRAALVNTTVSGLFLETLAVQGIECVALIHELRGVLDQYRLHGHAEAIAAHARRVVFPAAEVERAFSDVAPVAPAKLAIRPQGIYKRRDKSRGESDRARLREELDLPEDAQIVLGVGYADRRKGVDLFVAAGMAMASRLPKASWVWIGNWEATMQHAVEKQLAGAPELKDRFIFPGLQQDTDLFYGGADVFALTSREDPFPSVVLEALDAGVPVVGFEDAGGFIGLFREGCGRLVEKENPTAFGEAVAHLLEQPEARLAAGARGAELAAERFSFRHYVFDLLDFLGMGLDRISVVVPNYNYAHYLPERLNSILRQDYPVFEILFLDDRSQDDSLAVASRILSAQPIDYRIIPSAENSGSVFRQWKKGVDLARGSHVWIAEADDSCSEHFLSETRKGFRTPGVVLSYCESRQIDENGQALANNYLAYVSDIDARRWLSPFVMDGDKAALSFCIKNVVPNVSAVLFETGSLRAVLDRHIERVLSYRVAGDWLVYVLLLKQGRMAFTPVPANAHRRHQRGVTLGSFNAAQLEEIRGMQAFVATEFPIAAEQVAAARAYTARLAEQFGLATLT